MTNLTDVLANVKIGSEIDEDIVCSSCWGEHSQMIAEVAYGIFLVLTNSGQYVLMDAGGHRMNALAIMDEKPTPDPMPIELERKFSAVVDGQGAEFDLYLTTLQAQTIWMDKAKTIFNDLLHGNGTQEPLNMTETWQLVNRFVEAGFDPDENFTVETWLYDYMGHIIQEWERYVSV